MTVKFANDVRTTLSADIYVANTVIHVQDTSSFPTLVSGDYLYLTISNTTNTVTEIVKCTNVSGTQLTVIRGAESTTALDFSAGSHVQLRITAGLLADALAALESTVSLSGYSIEVATAPPVTPVNNTIYLIST